MSSRNDLSDHLVVLQLNADLRSAQVDLLSAQCATDRLRLRFSTDDLARHSQRDLLRKAAGSTSRPEKARAQDRTTLRRGAWRLRRESPELAAILRRCFMDPLLRSRKQRLRRT